MKNKRIYFIINLLQDVNIVRGLVYLAKRETDAEVGFLVSQSFLKRDKQNIWQKELAQMARDVAAKMTLFTDAAEAFAVLQGGSGMIFAASESNLSAHHEATQVFRVAPSSYIRVTLQHGLECIGFLQSREHVIGHGRNISFGSDIVCAWFDAPALTSLIASERNKLYVSGPPTLLQTAGHHPEHPPQDGGIVCENMHSVRLKATGDHKASFMDIFFDFCSRQAEAKRNVTLRPHPGGQYVIKNNISLPENVRLNNLPIFHVNMKDYAYGISAPSTIVFDMVLAGIPVGVWRDPNGVMDASNYDGLTEISDLQSWLAFERDVRLRRDMILDNQARFLDRLQMPTDPNDVYRRFARLMVAGVSGARPVNACVSHPPKQLKSPQPQRVLFIANGMIPTMQLSFLKPLKPLIEAGTLTCDFLLEEEIIARFKEQRRSNTARDWMREQLREKVPDLIVCCRYSGPHSESILNYGRQHNVPVVYHVDDDLLNIPPEIGATKFRVHNDPKRRRIVRSLLEHADLRYFSTQKLRDDFHSQGFQGPSYTGQIYSAAQPLRAPQPGAIKRIGYMGFDHAHDFEIAVPALEMYLERNQTVEFELFGPIPLPDGLKRFGDRVRTVEPVRNYEEFLKALAGRNWDIGICPLQQSPFNRVKANTKWVEYTACGMATIASKGLVYDDCAAQERGLLVSDSQWLDALQKLTDAPDLRYQIAQNAQVRLRELYTDTQLRTQISDVFSQALSIRASSGCFELAPPALEDMQRALEHTTDNTLVEIGS